MSDSDLEILNINKSLKKFKKKYSKKNKNNKNKNKIKNVLYKRSNYRRHKCTKSIKKRIQRYKQEKHIFKILDFKQQKLNKYFSVQGKTNKYRVSIQEKPQCTCADYSNREDVCKHMIFVYVKHYKLDIQNEIIIQKKLTKDDLNTLNN